MKTHTMSLRQVGSNDPDTVCMINIKKDSASVPIFLRDFDGGQIEIEDYGKLGGPFKLRAGGLGELAFKHGHEEHAATATIYPFRIREGKEYNAPVREAPLAKEQRLEYEICGRYLAFEIAYLRSD